MTPPGTLNGSQEDLSQNIEAAQAVFHPFLRAFYPFYPTYDISDTTVTLPLNEGDVILVHSRHTNGWADGTLLVSGARGWLPMNYCEAYDPESMRNLLKALLNFWDLMRSGIISDSEVFTDQEFMRGITAGVRYLLEKSNCLTRESHLVQGNEGLRRNRKALLSDLSVLAKTAKRLQEYTAGSYPMQAEEEDVNNTIDEMILKAFKIVTRGVRFLDVLEDELRSRQQPDGRVVSGSGSGDQTVPLWDALTGNPSEISSQATWGARRSFSEEGASELSGVYSDSSSEAEAVLSVAGSASSGSSITAEVEIFAGEDFAKLLLKDEELKSLFVSAIESDRIGVAKFEREFCRLLDHFSVLLNQEAKIKEQNDAVYLIRSQSRSVARYVCNSIAPSTSRNRFNRLQRQSGDKTSKLFAQQSVNQYLEQSYIMNEDDAAKNDSHEQIQGRPHVEAESDTDSDVGEEFENYEMNSSLSRVQDFIISSTAFSGFRENLRSFARQDFMSEVNSLIRKLTPRLERSTTKLNYLARELALIPPTEIWLSFKEDLGLSNQLKSMVEDLTHQTWEWWPLTPCRRQLSTGYARLFWNCPCGEVRWEDVPLSFAKQFGKLLKQTTSSLSTQVAPSAPHSDSTAQAANSANGTHLNPLDRNSLGLIQNQHGYNSYNNPRADEARSTGNATRTTRGFQSLPTTYVLLGVTVGNDLRLAQIEVRDVSHTTDDNFFKEVKYQYTMLRGLFRSWFSIYTYAHCHFVKFEKIGDNEIVSRDKNSIPAPGDLKYQYTPKPVEHMPPITEHEFRRRFYACYHRCSVSKIMLLSAFHKCGKVCRQAQVLSRIPKKTCRLEESGDTREIFWGILAMEDISFLMVSTYHFFILAPGFIFWFLWLFCWDHSGDLQNASVPFLALLACLPLFWFPLVVKTK